MSELLLNVANAGGQELGTHMPAHKPHAFDAEVFRGLPKPSVAQSLNSILFDTPASDRKYTKPVTAQLDDTMWQAMQDLIANKKLPFDGHMSVAIRHALGMFIEATEEYLDEGGRTLFRVMMDQQRRLTRERLIVTINDLIDKQVETLRFWTSKSDWKMVVRGLAQFLDEVQQYPEKSWREHAAQTWLRHPGVKSLNRFWEERMKEDSIEHWRTAIKIQKDWEEVAGD